MSGLTSNQPLAKTSNIKADIAIVGGGTTGLLTAALLSKQFPDKKIVLVEKNKTLGGLLRSFDYEENGRFDYGAHNFQETLIPEIDDLFLNLIPADQWHVLPGAKREIAGNFFQGSIHTNTPFMDLRNLPQEEYSACVADFFLNINTSNGMVNEYPQNAYDFSVARYGKTIAEKIIGPPVERLFGMKLRQLHRLPLNFLPFSRIAFLEDEVVCDLTRSDILRERIAYSNQRLLPLERSSGKRIFYPQKMGMQQLIDGFQALLCQRGVKIMTDTNVIELESENNQISSLKLQTAEDEVELSCNQLIWTAGVHPLAKTLDLFYPGDTFDKPLKTVFVHYRLSNRPALEDIYFLYPFDAGLTCYRVVNYANYCPEASQGPDYPVTLELFLPSDQSIDSEKLKQRGLDELIHMGIVPAETIAKFAAVETTSEGFPMPSMKNMSLTRARRERIQDCKLHNLTLLGILAEEDLLFHKDIILHTYHTLKALFPVPALTTR